MVTRHSKNFLMIIFFAFVLLFSFSFSSSALATSSSITMSTDDADFTIYPTESGSLIESSTGTIISITTDNYTGYKLTLESTFSTSPALVNVADSSKSIPSITSTISQSDFSSNSAYVNKWGIKPSKLNGSANSNYLPAPTSTAITIEQTAAANPTTANTYTIYPAARINYEVEAGSYSATLIAKAVINPATYTITYADSSSSASNMPSTQTGTTSDSTVTLSSNTPARTNYTFQGWCTTTVTNQDTTSPSCSGTTYSASSNYSIGQTTNNSLSLNAIWQRVYFGGITTMQAMTPAICANETENASVQLTDTRDSKKYWVTKLADGNCWMTQNLDLDITAAGFTNADTDLNSVTVWNSSSTYPPLATVTTTTSNSSDTGTASWSLGDYAYDGTTFSSCGKSATSYADCTSYGFTIASSPTVAANHYHVGNLYQWNAATAGSGGVITSGEAEDSICPKGWRLPTGNSSGEFEALVTAYSASSMSGTQILLDSPLYFIRGGYVYYSGFLYSAGYMGYYWSSTPNYNITNGSYGLSFSTNYPISTGVAARYNGQHVRCIARGYPSSISEITTMQELGSLPDENKTLVLSSMTTGTQYQLEDSRDNKLYWVSKLADGNVWMTQNLDFEISASGTTLTAADSDVTSDRTFIPGTNWNGIRINFYEGGDYYLPGGSGSATSTSSLASNDTNWHYQVGDYYNWNAATAGSGASVSSGSDAEESICPKGWELPNGHQYYYDKSFNKLTEAYDIEDGSSGVSDAALLASPLYFVRAGANWGGDLDDLGITGYVWGSNKVSTLDAGDFTFTESSVIPRDYMSSGIGFSVRCVLK